MKKTDSSTATSFRRTTKRLTLLGAVLGAFVSGLGCSSATPVVEPVSSAPAPNAPPLPTCLVLSVGAEKGLAHIGVIEELKAHHVEIDCVIGTSMGSLVGALYAHEPDAEIAEEYRALFRVYVEQTKSEATKRGVVWFLAGAAAVALSGGAAGPALAAGAGAGAVGAVTTEEKDIERLREVMQEHFDGKRIEDLPLDYRTIHQRVGETGISKVPIRGGDLGTEISWSVANPLIFPGIELESGARIDPGADSVAAVPLEYACAEFPRHQFIVSNVTGDELFVSKKMNCPFTEITPKPPQVDRGKAIIGDDPEYSEIRASGRVAAQVLDWAKFPTHKKDKAPVE